MNPLSETQLEAILQECREGLQKKHGGSKTAYLVDLFGSEEEFRRIARCPRERFAAFIDGGLTPAEDGRVSRHVSVCPFCSQDVAAIREAISSTT